MANVDYILKLSEQFRKIAYHFDLEEFSSLPTGIENGRLSPQRHTMLSQLPISGIGGSRNVYILNSKKALKVAKNIRGLEGNKIEFENLKKYDSVWLPKVFDRANDYSWIEVEYVTPLDGFYEIDNLIGIDHNIFLALLLERDYTSNFDDAIINAIADSNADNSEYKKYIGNNYLKDLDRLIDKMSLDQIEFRDVGNLGKSASGHLVLLDIGELKGE